MDLWRLNISEKNTTTENTVIFISFKKNLSFFRSIANIASEQGSFVFLFTFNLLLKREYHIHQKESEFVNCGLVI